MTAVTEVSAGSEISEELILKYIEEHVGKGDMPLRILMMLAAESAQQLKQEIDLAEKELEQLKRKLLKVQSDISDKQADIMSKKRRRDEASEKDQFKLKLMKAIGIKL